MVKGFPITSDVDHRALPVAENDPSRSSGPKPQSVSLRLLRIGDRNAFCRAIRVLHSHAKRQGNGNRGGAPTEHCLVLRLVNISSCLGSEKTARALTALAFKIRPKPTLVKARGDLPAHGSPGNRSRSICTGSIKPSTTCDCPPAAPPSQPSARSLHELQQATRSGPTCALPSNRWGYLRHN